MDSKILAEDKQYELLNLLYDHLESKAIDANLLFRASENAFDRNKFIDAVDGKGPTITIIENEHEHIFGAYVSIEWTKKPGQYADPIALMFSLKPRVLKLTLKKDQNDGKSAMWIDTSYGPVFGRGADIYIRHKCNLKDNGGGSCSFEFNRISVFGGNGYFKVKDYEVFSLSVL